MIIDKLINWVASKQEKSRQEDIAFGLAFGLVFGLAAGLAFGLAAGLAFGLAAGLASGLANLITSGFFPKEWIFALIGIFILTELLFWILDKSKPKTNESRLFFTVKRKGLAILESMYLMGNGLGAYDLITKGVPMLMSYFKINYEPILQFFGYGPSS